MNNQNAINQLVELAAEKRELMKSAERLNISDLAEQYWRESNGMIECIATLANCHWVDAFDMVINRMIERKNK